MTNQPLKQCPGCKQWLTLHELMHDSSISPLGIQIDPLDQDQCYYQFIHLRDHCLSTFLIHSSTIRQVVGPADSSTLPQPEHPCSGFCTEMHELASCRANCSLQLHRDFILSLRQQYEDPPLNRSRLISSRA